MTAPQILSRLSVLHVGLSVSNGRIKARMTKPDIPIPVEARSLIRRVKPHLLDLLDEEPAFRRAKGDERCGVCRERDALLCSECCVEIVTD